MTGNGNDTTGEPLILRSRLSELTQLSAWIERLASQHSIPDNTRFAVNLCLEEVLSNVIQHGYSRNPDRSMIVQFTRPREGTFVFVVEDEAPLFNPLESPDLPALSSLDEARVGGQGIRLLRRFADELEYQPTPTGNRLCIGFSPAGSAIKKD